MKQVQVPGVLVLAVCVFAACSCTAPSKPASTAGAAGAGATIPPQFTLGHWTIMSIELQAHVTPAQKARMDDIDRRCTAKIRQLQAQAARDILAELVPQQREQFTKKYGHLENWYVSAMIVPMIDREVDLAGFQKERMNKVVEKYTALLQAGMAAMNNELYAVLTAEQRDEYARNQVYQGVWAKIACVHPTQQQQDKFKTILDETIKGANLGDQKTREELTMKIYIIVRDTVLTDEQLKFFKFYPQAFYPDKPLPAAPNKYTSVSPGTPPTGGQPPKPMRPYPQPQAPRGNPVVQWMDREVQLTPAQVEQMNKADAEYAAKVRDAHASLNEDFLAMLTGQQKEQFTRKFPDGIPAYIEGQFLPGWVQMQVALTADQKEKFPKLCQRHADKLKDLACACSNSLVAAMTPEQRDKWCRARLRQAVWDKIACVHPTAEQVAKFEGYMNETAAGANIADQKTRDDLAMKVYIHVRDHILTEGQLGFFKLYPNAFYPDKPEMQKPAPKANVKR